MSNEIVLKALEEHAKAMDGFRAGIQSDIAAVKGQVSDLSTEVDKKLGIRKTCPSLTFLVAGAAPTLSRT